MHIEARDCHLLPVADALHGSCTAYMKTRASGLRGCSRSELRVVWRAGRRAEIGLSTRLPATRETETEISGERPTGAP